VNGTPLRDVLLAAEQPVPGGPSAAALRDAFAASTRRRHRRAVATFQWLALAFYTVLAADAWRRGHHAGVAAGWLLLAALAVLGPRIAARRLARLPLRAQVRLAGQVEGASVWFALTIVPVLALALVERAAAIEIRWPWLVASCVFTVPALAVAYRRLARAWARRFDPEWWD
jgi:hypothetical protein